MVNWLPIDNNLVDWLQMAVSARPCHVGGARLLSGYIKHATDDRNFGKLYSLPPPLCLSKETLHEASPFYLVYICQVK